MERPNNSRILKSPIPERIKEARLSKGFTVQELADLLEISRQAVSQYELGQTSPSAAIMAKMVEILGLSYSFYLKPINLDYYSNTIFFRCLKSADKNSKDKVRIRSNWLGEIYQYLQEFLNFPDVNIPDLGSLLSKEILSHDDLENIAVSVRKAWGLGLGPIPNLTLLLEKQGFIVSRNKLGDEKTDACSQWRGKRPFIFLGSDKESAVRSRFDAAHELAHLILHNGITQEQMNDKDVFNRLEKEAHYFASAFLLPKDTFSQEVMSTSLEHFISLKKRWKVSIAAMVYRCDDLGILSESQILYLRKQMAKYNIRTHEPLDDEITPENPTVLKQAIMMLIEKGVQSIADIKDALRFPTTDIEELCNLPSGTLKLQGQVISLNIK